MGSLTSYMADGGPWMYVILGSVVLSILWSMALSVAGMMRMRVPSLLYWGPAVFVICVGALGSVYGQHLALQAMAHASEEMKGTLMAAGHGMALISRIGGHFGGMIILVWAALCAGLAAAVRPGEAPRGSWGSAIGAGAMLGMGGVVLAIVAWLVDAGFMGVVLALQLALVGSLGAFLAGARTSQVPDDADRVGELRLTVVGALFGAVVCGAYGIVDQGTSEAHQAIAMAAPESRLTLMAMGESLSGGGWWMMGLGLPLVAMSMSFMVRPSTGRLLDGRGTFSMVATTLGWLTWLLLLAVFSWRAVGYQDLITAVVT